MQEITARPKRICIIGGGISGIACLWGLREQPYQVDLYESEASLGGHANSTTFVGDNGITAAVDTGFITMNDETYPQFARFLERLGVKTIPTDMSFSLSEDDGACEWSSISIWAFIGKVSNLYRAWFWRLMFEILRFNFFATDILDEGDTSSREKGSPLESIGDYLKRRRYSPQFMRYYLIPMVAAPWCIDPDEFGRDFPAADLIHFMAGHRLLDTVTNSLRWRTFRQGSREYIDAFMRTLKPQHRVHLNTPVSAVRRLSSGEVEIKLTDGPTRSYDHAVLAIHAGQALRCLGHDATSLETEVLSKFKTSRNVCYLHSDTTVRLAPFTCTGDGADNRKVLAKRKSAQASWNCLLKSPQAYESGRQCSEDKSLLHSEDDKSDLQEDFKIDKMSLVFDMNRLQGIPFPGEEDSPGRVLVSMNPIRMPRSYQSSHVYHHPLFSSASFLAARRLREINSNRHISFAGAWMGYGFHEDGFVAGTRVARNIVTDWADDVDMDIRGRLGGSRRQIGWKRKVVRAVLSAVQLALEVLGGA